MSRTARVISPTEYYHVMMRGINKEAIFRDEKGKIFFINILKVQAIEELIEVVAYCIMDNHVHLVLKGKIDNLTLAIKRINIRYAMKFNKHMDRIGHVFQDRFKSEVILNDTHLFQVIRYVHNNPVKANMIKNPSEYEWSSYNEYINKNNVICSQQKKFILGYVSNSIKKFTEFHYQDDNNEYLDLKEDIQRLRIHQAQQFIERYFQEKGIIEF
ncbi:transposase [Clostridium sp. D2Q-11]|uniref:Transposase n=1 Tax=Anaeromonas frigoriresistens TaxID=2683708 RepID=A0A942UVQ9_9FIRM|nr:transposase [Anaeromonas frigoriresistens]MBS4539473.1 transposase [Anaeromonas frigoriresistens]